MQLFPRQTRSLEVFCRGAIKKTMEAQPKRIALHPTNISTAPTIHARGDSQYRLVDIGANLTHPTFHPVDEVIQRAAEAGVLKIIVTGTSVETSRDALRLAHLFPQSLYSTSGVHPHDAKTWTESSTRVAIEQFAAAPECVAIGECGLDFNRNFSPQDVQREVFEKQVQIACRLRKPMFIHEREAHQDMVAILSKYAGQLPPIVMHCFTGSMQEAQKYIDMGFYIGLTGFLWKDKSDNGVRKMLESRAIPLDRLLIETDAPYMYPNVTRKSKLPAHVLQGLTKTSLEHLQHCSFNRNEPCSLPITCEMISAFMNTSPQVVAAHTYDNALRFFGIQQ